MLHHEYLAALEKISHEGDNTPESDALVAAIVQYEEENGLIPPLVVEDGMTAEERSAYFDIWIENHKDL
jgi:hypothetical protein